MSKVVEVPRFAPMHGWTNRILRIDLSDMAIWAQETAPYVPDYLAARGIAHKIAWDEYPEPVDGFDPRNPLMVFPGVLTGARAPYSGRTNVCAFSPQGYPYPWFSRSSIGGRFGGELKRAGYDGIVITGASEEPVRIRIHDDEVSIVPAEDLWGLDALDALDALEAAGGKGTRSLTIGPTGERLSRIATIQTASSSACGNGGFGAVMGSKKLKAISVRGTGKVSLADPERVTALTRAVGKEMRSFLRGKERVRRLNERLSEAGDGGARLGMCTEGCVSPCKAYYEGVPGCAYDRKWSGSWMCVGTILRGLGEDGPISHGGVFDWKLGTRGGMEANALCNRYGINQWDLIIGMVPWLEACQNAGLISEMNGQEMDWQSSTFWAEFLHAIAYREGMGDALAEGGWRAAQVLRLGEDLVRRYYTGWGYAGHWDGHGSWSNYLVFPYWLVSALQWATDTRDPIPSGHGYVQNVMNYGPLRGRRPITWDHMRDIAARIYGDPDAVDPHSGYKAKAYPAFYHTKRSVMKDCLPADDFRFPMIYHPNSPDRFFRVDGTDGKTVDGPSVEYHLFKAGTGTDWTEEEFERAAERVYTLERAVQIRHWARDRAMDEMVLPSYEYLENWANPLLGERYALDREQFRPVMDDYYGYQGWDVETGWPTRERLAELGIEDAYEPMVAGARRAKEELPEPPRAEPVPLIHG
jgi:aldehyde:ferredoxin oxidoreductase